MPFFKPNAKDKDILLYLTLGVLVILGATSIGMNLLDANLKKTTSTTSNPNLQQAQAQTRPPIVVDHTSIELFDQIPPEYLEAARSLRMHFIDRSVGGNISQGLDCLDNPDPDSAPNHCKRPSLEESELVAGPQYDRSNWQYDFWDSGCSEWYDKINCFISSSTANIDQFDVLSFQYSYLAVDEPGIANSTDGFFVDNPNRLDVHDLEAFESQHPDKTFIYWTTSLSRSIGTQEAQDFNEQMRQYAIQNNKPLFDVADIESHDPAGNPCYDNRDGVEYCMQQRPDNCSQYPDDGIDLPAICHDYTSEHNGGHLGWPSTGKIRVAKGFWVLMAQIAGWVPNSDSITNYPPSVNAGNDLTVDYGDPITLSGTVSDDGRPATGSLTYNWTQSTGPSTASISNPNNLETGVTVNEPGEYTFMLTADDSELTSSDEVTVLVVDPVQTPTPTPAPTPTPTPSPTESPEQPASGDEIISLNFDSQPMPECQNCSYNDISLVSSQIGGSAYQFNGSTSQVSMPSLEGVQGSNQFSFSIWIKPNFDHTETDWHYVFSNGSSLNVFYLSNLNDWRVMLRTSSGNHRLDTQNLQWNAGEWHHLSLTYNGSTANLYWDGQLQQSANVTGAVATSQNTGLLGVSPVNHAYYNGALDKLTLFNTALSSSQVTTLYQSGQ